MDERINCKKIGLKILKNTIITLETNYIFFFIVDEMKNKIQLKTLFTDILLNVMYIFKLGTFLVPIS